MTANLTNIKLPLHVSWQIFSNVFVPTKFDEVRHRAHQVVHDCRKVCVGNVPLLAELSELINHEQLVITEINSSGVYFLPYYR